MKKILSFLLAACASYAHCVLAAPVYPLNLLNRASLRGPLMTSVASKPNQWAGLTTIPSGSTSQVVSSSIVGSDSLISTFLRASIPAGYITQGRTAIASGIATGVVSTAAVGSNSVINLSIDAALNTTSGVGKGLRVNSIVDGVSFAITAVDSFGYPGAISAMWSIPGAELKGLVVNTIVQNSYFVLAWADGVARPLPVTAMWEMRRTG